MRYIQAIYSYPNFFSPNKDLCLSSCSLHNIPIAECDQGICTDPIYSFCHLFRSCCLQRPTGNNKVLCSSFMGCWKRKTLKGKSSMYLGWSLASQLHHTASESSQVHARSIKTQRNYPVSRKSSLTGPCTTLPWLHWLLPGPELISGSGYSLWNYSYSHMSSFII